MCTRDGNSRFDQEGEKNYFDMSRFTDLAVHKSVERTNQNCDLGPGSLTV